MSIAKVVAGRKVRYAVVGVGWISQAAMLPGIEHTGNSELVALVTGHEEKALKVGAKYGLGEDAVFHYDDFGALLASGKIDAVYLATPNADHVAMAVMTLEAGVHLLLEKPMAVSVAECERIIAASEQSGAKLMIAYRLHHEPGTLAAFETARSGKLGKLRYFNSSFSQPVSGQNHRAKNGYWAGPVPDMGPYPINTVRNLFCDEPIEVSAMGTKTDERFTMHDTVIVNLRFPLDRIATMVMSYNAADLDDYRIVGELGDVFAQPAFQVGSQMKQVVTIAQKKEERSFPKTDHFGGEMQYFSDCVIHDKHPEADGEEGLLDVRILEAVERALATGQTQILPSYTRKRRPTMAQEVRLKAASEPELVDSHKPSEGQ